MDFFIKINDSFKNDQMSDRDKQEFAEALSFRYNQLTDQLASDLSSEDPKRQRLQNEFTLLHNIILDLPSDILHMVMDQVTLRHERL